MPRPVLALPAAAAALALLITTVTPATADTPPATTTDASAAAAGWLAQQFADSANRRGPGGDHIELSYNDGTKDVLYYDGGGTADAAFALAATKSGKSKIDTAVGYVGAHLDAYVDYSGTQGGPYYGSIAKAALAAIVDGRDPNNVGGHHLLSELKKDECPAGSTTCTPGTNSNVFSSVSTSFIVIAEARGGRVDGSSVAPSQDLLTFFLSLQCPDGGFTSDLPVKSPCTSDPDATGYAVMALQAVGGHTAEIARAAGYLEKSRGKDGAWSDNGGSNIDSTGLAAAALSIAGRDTSRSRAWLSSQQVTDGPTTGAGARRGALKYQGAYDANASIKGTSDAILGLVPGASLATLDATGARDGTSVLALAAPSVRHASVRAGSAQTVTGAGFAAREKVRASVRSTPIPVGAATASADGTATVTFTVPPSLAAGRHTVELTGARSGLSSAVSFTVVAAAPTGTTSASGSASGSAAGSAAPSSASPVLAVTGRDDRRTGWELLAGLGCIALGGVALLAGRRRAQHR
jgi:hypothetical protein